MAPAAAPTLTQAQLNRAVLARQLLLERPRTPVPRALERVAGLQAQYAPSMYIGLWSRVAGLRREQVTRALERRSVVQATLMRSTIHLVSAHDYWPLAIAIQDGRRAWWMRVQRGTGPQPERMEALARDLRALLGAAGTLRRREIEATIGKAETAAVGIWLDLVRVPPSGTWERRRADTYAAAEDWLGPAAVAPADAAEHLVRRYLRAFGPATRADVCHWAGVAATDLAPAFERIELRRFRSEDGKELVDLPRAPLPDPDTPAPVRFLPTWDATLLVHVRRSGILPEAYRPLIFHTKNPQSTPTFLVDGQVAGTWREQDGRVTLNPFEPLSRRVRRELEEEAARLEHFLA